MGKTAFDFAAAVVIHTQQAVRTLRPKEGLESLGRFLTGAVRCCVLVVR